MYVSSLSRSKPCNTQQRQRGVILIMVLLIVAVVAGLAVKYTADFQLSLARAESRWHSAQARAFLTGTEAIAGLLFKSADIDLETDYLGEPWGNEVPIYDEGVTGVAQLVDATNVLNLNDLLNELSREKPMGSPDRYSEPQRRFIRLLQTFPDLQISQQQAEGILEAVVDWIDEDDAESGTYGAESNYYQGRPMPYRAANKLFVSIEELRLVRGFDEMPELFLRLQPFITVLPKSGVGININTVFATLPQSAEQNEPLANNIVRAFGAQNSLMPLDDSTALQLLAGRPETGFADISVIADGWKQLMGEENPLGADGLNFKTDYFWLIARVQMGDQRLMVRSLFQRDNSTSGITVVNRADVYELPVPKINEKSKQTRLFSE